MNQRLPTNVDIASARFPATYEQAKVALASCVKIDECQEWANKAEALASYARMADDDTLRKLADRIQARAVRRMGELLKQFDARGDHRKNGGTPTSSRREVAEHAGISKNQQVQAVRVANVPEETFNAAIDAPKPATVTALAELGKQTRAAPAAGFTQATQLIGTVQEFAEFCEAHDPEFIAGGVLPSEIARIRRHVEMIDEWLDRFVVNLGKAVS